MRERKMEEGVRSHWMNVNDSSVKRGEAPKHRESQFHGCGFL